MSATDALEVKLLNHVLRNTAMVQPTALYIALHTADPGETGIGSEVAGGSYARQTIAFTPATSGQPAQATNTNLVTFASLPAATISNFTIADAVTAGNVLFVGTLSTPKVTGAGDTITFPIGQIIVTAD